MTFHCPVDRSKPLQLMYLQKGGIFVNGFHASNDVSSLGWANSRVDNDTILMSGLNVSHRGDYRCIVWYDGGVKPEPDFHFHLSVTANYSKPTLLKLCGDDDSSFSFLVLCASHGGFPVSEITWRPPGGSKVVNSSKLMDPDTQTFNISSTASANCSDGKPTSVSCSVGNVSSDPLSVCSPEVAPETPGHHVAAVVVPVVLVLLMLGALLFCCVYKNRQRGAGAAGRERGGEERVTYSAVRPRSQQEVTGNTSC